MFSLSLSGVVYLVAHVILILIVVAILCVAIDRWGGLVGVDGKIAQLIKLAIGIVGLIRILQITGLIGI